MSAKNVRVFFDILLIGNIEVLGPVILIFIFSIGLSTALLGYFRKKTRFFGSWRSCGLANDILLQYLY